MDREALYIVAIIGIGTLIGVFNKMKNGFGPFNLRVVGIVLVAQLAVILALVRDDNLNAAMGILGAIAGYLFGAKDETKKSKLDVKEAQFGDNAKLAGRDINETVNNINAKVNELGELFSKERVKIDDFIASQLEKPNTRYDYLINTIYSRDLPRTGRDLETVIFRWEANGWKFKGLSSDFHGMDGIFLLFERESGSEIPTIQVFHGSDSNQEFPRDT